MTEPELQKTAALEQISMVLGGLLLLQLKDLDQNQKAAYLNRCGYSTIQIAALLNTTTGALRVALHRSRKITKRKTK